MNLTSPFFLVSVETKKFLSHDSNSVSTKWDVSPDQLWYGRNLYPDLGSRIPLEIIARRGGSYLYLMDSPGGKYLNDSRNGKDYQVHLFKIGPNAYHLKGASYRRDRDTGEVYTVYPHSGYHDDTVFRKIYAKDFFGCVHWNADYHTTSNPSFVQEGLQAIEQLGFGVAKVKINDPTFEFRGRVPNHDSRDIVNTIERVFKNNLSSFHTIILCIWSDVHWDQSYFLNLEGQELQEQLSLEYQFFHHLTQYLERTFTNKTIILQNWESDWKFDGPYTPKYLDDPRAVTKIKSWFFARQGGVSSGRNPNPRADSTKVLHAIEVNKVVDGMRTGSRNMTSLVVPNVDFDLVSYSMYEPHENGILSQSLGHIENLMTEPSDYMKKLAEIDERFVKRVYLGEYGTPRTPHTNQVRENIGVLVNAMSWGCPLALYWQVFENEWKENGDHPARGLLLPVHPENVVYFNQKETRFEGEEGALLLARLKSMTDPLEVEITEMGKLFKSLLT